jgi:hypothetical protein
MRPWSIRSRRLLFAVFTLAALTVAGTVHAHAQDSDSDTAKRGRKYKAPPPTAHVEVTVTRATNGKPIENAAVIFHPLVDGRDRGNMELKTNDEGKAVIELLDLGSSVRLQIIAPGFQTYGEDYKVDKDNLAIEVKLKRPVEQYSIYKKTEGKTASPAPAPDTSPDKPTDKPKDAAAPNDGSAPQPETKPDTPPDTPKDQAKPQSSTPPSY